LNQKSNSRKHLKLFIIYYTGVLKRKIFKIRLVKIKSLIPTPLEYDFCLLVLSAEEQSFWPLVLFRLRNILGGLYISLITNYFFFSKARPSKTMVDHYDLKFNFSFSEDHISFLFYLFSFEDYLCRAK
jgi:hypothetical protein